MRIPQVTRGATGPRARDQFVAGVNESAPRGTRDRRGENLENLAFARYAFGVAQIGRLLLVAGGVLALTGGLLLLGDKIGLGRLPGDLLWRKKGVTVYVPLVTSLVVSIVLTLVLNLFLRRK